MLNNGRKQWVHYLLGIVLILVGGYVLSWEAAASTNVPAAAPAVDTMPEGPPLAAAPPVLPVAARSIVVTTTDDVDVDPVLPAIVEEPAQPRQIEPTPAAPSAPAAIAAPAARPEAKPVQLAKTAAAPDSAAIVQSLQQKGTPAGNYKVSEVDDDIVLDAVAMTVSPEAAKPAAKPAAENDKKE